MFKRLKFYMSLDRIGPDMLLTHWMLYFKWLTRFVYKRKFYHFSDSAEIRPGSYLLNISTISIGKNVVIRPLSYIAGETLEHTGGKASIIIEDDALLSPGIHIYPSNHSFHNLRAPIMYQGDTSPKLIRIKRGAWLGANVIILTGTTVGENAVIGAGSIVTESIPTGVVAVGNPAKVIKKIKS